MRVKLKEDQPLPLRGNFTWLKKGYEFDVIEEKTDPLGDKYYVIRDAKFPSLVFDGMTRAKDFEVVGQ